MKYFIILYLLFFTTNVFSIEIIDDMLKPLQKEDALKNYKENSKNIKFLYNKYHKQAAKDMDHDIPSEDNFKNQMREKLIKNGEILNYQIKSEKDRLNGQMKKVEIEVFFKNGSRSTLEMDLLKYSKSAPFKIMNSKFLE